MESAKVRALEASEFVHVHKLNDMFCSNLIYMDGRAFTRPGFELMPTGSQTEYFVAQTSDP